MNDPDPEEPAVGGGEEHPLVDADDRWEAVVADMESTAEEYRDAGWDVVELHPGDVMPLPPAQGTDAADDGRVGLDILVPDNEFETLESRAADATFDAYDAYRARAGSVLFAVAAIESTEASLAVLVPFYYRVGDAEAMAERALERGRLELFVRPLADDRRVVFSQERPELLLPPALGGEDLATDG